jgi:formate--tetrahydrofolate ligase
MEFEMGQMASQHGALLKVGLFVLVQALVYLILAQSSSVFSSTKTPGLRPSTSLSARRMVALLSGLPLGGEPSPRAVSREQSPLAVPLALPAHQKKD